MVRLEFLVEGHRVVKKDFETEMWVDGNQLSLNNMMQETLANVLLGFAKTLKGADTDPKTVDVKIKRLAEPQKVDAHTYPEKKES